MRVLIFTLFIVFAALQEANAENWIRINDAKEGKFTAFELKSSCQAGGFKCQQIDGLMVEALTTGDVDVDDESKPIFEAKSNVFTCVDLAVCQTKRVEAGFCPETHFSVLNQTETGWEAYCTRRVGYEKKKELRIKEDPAKKAQSQSEATKAASKRSKVENAHSKAVQCIADLKGAATIAEVKQCLVFLLKLQLADKLNESEL